MLNIPIESLRLLIADGESRLDSTSILVWKMARIEPERWSPVQFHGHLFWAVGIMGKTVIWYDHVEEGFNFGQYTEY